MNELPRGNCISVPWGDTPVLPLPALQTRTLMRVGSAPLTTAALAQALEKEIASAGLWQSARLHALPSPRVLYSLFSRVFLREIGNILIFIALRVDHRTT